MFLYPNLCYNEVCYKGAALYLYMYAWYFCMLFVVCAFFNSKDKLENQCGETVRDSEDYKLAQ